MNLLSFTRLSLDVSPQKGPQRLLRPLEAEWCPRSHGPETPGRNKDPASCLPAQASVLQLTLSFHVQLSSTYRYEGGNGDWAPGALEPESVTGESSLGKGEPEIYGHLIKQIVDYLITLALECVGESQGDKKGELKGKAPSSSLKLSINQFKGS